MDSLFEYSKFALCVAGVIFFLTGFIFFTIKIDESDLDKTRYCPSCGVDLINSR